MSETNTRESVRDGELSAQPSSHGGTAPSPLSTEKVEPPPANGADEAPEATNGAAAAADVEKTD